MHPKMWVLAVTLGILGCGGEGEFPPSQAKNADLLPPWAIKRLEVRPDQAKAQGLSASKSGSRTFGGHTSGVALEEHYQEYGRSFGSISIQEYFRRAKKLADRPVGPSVMEGRRRNGDTVRFDRVGKAILIRRPDGSIRSFYRAPQGERHYKNLLAR